MKRVFSIYAKNPTSDSIYFSWQRNLGNLIATNSGDNCVQVYNKKGKLIQEINLVGICTGFGWSKDGSILSIINNKTGMISMWMTTTNSSGEMESGFREKDILTFLAWSKTNLHLAIGTIKGNLMLYNHQTAKKVTILGKHTKRISTGAWSKENLLALSGDDRNVTVSNLEGDTITQVFVNGEVKDVQFSEMKRDERSLGENTISLIKNLKMLYLIDINDTSNPIEMSFTENYGTIVSYSWHGDGYIVMGFSNGYFVVISTHIKEMGQELFQVRNYKSYLSYVSISTQLNMVATVGDNSVKMHDLGDHRQMTSMIQFDPDRTLDRLKWTDDGQLFAISASSSSSSSSSSTSSSSPLPSSSSSSSRAAVCHIYLAKMTMICDSWCTKVAYLSSLLEVTVEDKASRSKSMSTVVEVEPSFVTLGPTNLAVGMNNRAWFYAITDDGIHKMKEQEYLSTIQSFKINSKYAAVGYDGKITLQIIDEEEDSSNQRDVKTFPDRDQNKQRVTSHFITEDFLIFSTDKGIIYHFHLDDWEHVSEFHHLSSVKKIFPNNLGSLIMFVDEKAEAYVLNVAREGVTNIFPVSPKLVGVLWDCWPEDKNTFIAYDSEMISAYCYLRDSTKGSQVLLAGETKMPLNHSPMTLYRGNLTLQSPTGSIVTNLLSTHPPNLKDKHPNAEELQSSFKKSLDLLRFPESYRLCELINNNRNWEELGTKAIMSLDIESAMKAYRGIGDVGMVMSLQDLLLMEDKNLLCGHLSLLAGDFDQAQISFLNSSKPAAALEMRRDLMHWDQALQLARKFSEHEIPFISREYAQQLEFIGEYNNSLRHYEQGVTKDPLHRDHDEACAAGVARMSLRNGDIRRGVNLALKLPSKAAKKDCAVILESIKQYQEAGMLYEKAGFHDKAANAYIKSKNWTKVGELLPNVSTPKIHAQYGRAKEASGSYKEAAKAYEGAKDWEGVIRINLTHLKNPDEAARIVRMTNSIEGAKMVARFFENLQDYSSAIQFLVLSKCNDEAFRLAEKHGHMEKYADIIGNDATPEDYKSIALHFENQKNHHLAGKFHYLAGAYSKALSHLLDTSNHDNEDSLDLAVEVAGQSNEHKLIKRLIDHLMGDEDGQPKDPKYLFKLYMVLKKYEEAASIAVIIAREEQNAGNYKLAHGMMFEMCTQLRQSKLKVPSEMYYNLTILHSYTLVKIQIKLGEHLKAARLLIRVANNISKFSSHVVPILTTTVIECHRSGLKKSSFSYAAMLMKPEYREKIDDKYRKRVETIVRKPEKTELEENLSPCPFCGFNLSDMELSCPGCKNNIPFCIASGRHIIKDKTTICPNCQFPAIIEEFVSLLKPEDSCCPMCQGKIDSAFIQDPIDINKILQASDIAY